MHYFHLQFDKTQINIEAELHEIICKPDKLHICSSNHSTEQEWPKKREACPYSPIATTVWQDQINSQTELRQIISNPGKLHVY